MHFYLSCQVEAIAPASNNNAYEMNREKELIIDANLVRIIAIIASIIVNICPFFFRESANWVDFFFPTKNLRVADLFGPKTTYCFWWHPVNSGGLFIHKLNRCHEISKNIYLMIEKWNYKF